MSELTDYVLGEVLYVGPETRVCRALHRPSGARVVLKQLGATAPTARQVGRLVHEHDLLVKLASVPGVARVRALEQQGEPVLVLDDPGFRSLDRVLAERGRLPIETSLRLGLALARVLAEVHAAGVIHKDVKPQNLLVDETCAQAVLLDFGIASWLPEEATSAQIPEALEGTLAYLSPEQTGRTARALDARTDLYSLGVTLFEALAGRRPFVETDPLALVHAHLAKAPPPLESLVDGVPGVVAQILARCLEKHPDKRYQTAKGLSADLERCLDEFVTRGVIEPFPLGQKDFSLKLQLPQALVSREEESQVITAAFERAAAGAVEVLLLGGPSGVGKTALVRSVYREIAKAGRGLLLSGKHDQLGSSVPYASLTQAFRGLMSNLAESPKPVFDAWRERFARALGPLARVIADLVPELEWLMGPLPPLPVVPAEMMYNRFKLAWIEFVRAVTDASPPLVLFLDDLQWVDPASLALLKTLLTDVGQKSLLVIASYRDNEVEPRHPLWKFVAAMEESGVETPRLTVGPLSEAAVQTWLSVALSATRERVRPLAEALFRKTHGSPFFLEQLLLELHRQKRVRRDLDDGAWEWDQNAVERAAVTDNVLELMLRQVAELPAETQELLGQAACAGHSFSFGELSVLTARSPSEVTRALWPALQAGLVIPSDGQYREAQALAQAGAEQGGKISAHYLFLHDRVQQAFYERIAKEHRARTHLLIGRRLEQAFEQEGGSNQKLLELTRHLNLGAEALASEVERKELARLDLRAAKAAKASGSYRLQATLVEQAQGLLGERASQEEPALAVELALERVEADYLLREFNEVHRRAQELLALPLPTLPRLCAQELRVRTCVASGQYPEGERLGLAALAEQGITYPESDAACMALSFEWMNECDAWLDRHPEGFGAMAANPSIEHLLSGAMQAAMLVCAGLTGHPALTILAVTRGVKQAIERAVLTPAEPFFIGCLSQTRSAALGDYRGGVRWAREGERAATKLASPFFPECSYYRGIYETYERPVEQTREYYQAGVRAAMESGSFQGTSWALGGELHYADLWAGRPLSEVAEKEQSQRDVMARAGDAGGKNLFALAAQVAAFLRAPEHERPAPGEDWLTTSSRSFDASGDGLAAESARILEAHLFLAFGEPALALERAEEADRFRAAVYGNPPATDIPLWRGLAAAQCWSPALGEAERAALLSTVEQAIERFRYFSEGCAENFLHKLCLLEAEQARVQGNTELAMAKYEQAIDLAREQRFLHIEAMAAQFSAEFHLSAGRRQIGALYLHKARDAYKRWDALALVAHLEAKHPVLLKPKANSAPAERVTITSTTTATNGGSALDVNTAVRAAQALSSELDPDRVVGRLMELTLANAGAQRGALVLRDGEDLSVVARLSVEGARIETGLSEPLSQSREVAPTVVHYVARTSKPVVLADAQAEASFREDPYLSAEAVRSVLALPLTHRGHLVGVLYLEHRDTPLAFTPARISLLSVLASQAAIAVENAFLYRDLEAKVAQRTEEYKAAKQSADAANQAKSDFLASMSHELRTPLNGILGYAQILERLPDLPPEVHDGVRVIQRSGKHLLALINDVLDLAKIEAGKMVLVPRDFSLSSLVQTAVNLSRVRADQKGIAFHVEQSGPALLTVHADEKRLLQVLLNLLGNAIKFTDQGGVTLRVHVDEPSGAGQERQLRFQVLDTGPGIEAAQLSRIFSPFEQAGSSTSRAQGTGLGLAISMKIVEQMGGQLRVQSEVGKGSLFEVTLPLQAESSVAETAPSTTPGQIVGYAGERLRILVVDDKEDNRSVLRDMLVPVGFEVSEAASGAEALLMAASQKPAAVIVDLAMPGMDGYETTRRMRELPELSPEVVVVASSASFSQGEVQKSAEAGCQDFLPKPVQLDQLLEKLGRALRLTWVRDAEASAAQASSAETLLAPPPEELQTLLELARGGRVPAIRKQGRQLAQRDSRYEPWVAQLDALAQRFQLKELREFIASYAERAPS